jgi:hypothetical protein
MARPAPAVERTSAPPEPVQPLRRLVSHPRPEARGAETCRMEIFVGASLASTEVLARRTHAERHRLVNPVENNITADTQLALAA